MISVSHLVKYYADNLALDDVSFEVEAGEIVGFLGPNGAGKSTTMKIITCFIPPSAGTAVLAGCDILKDPMGVRRHVGYMPENVPLYTEMRIREYLKFRASIKDVPRRLRARRIDEVMERTHLTDRQRQTIGTLSKGYRQRVGLADAMVGDPDILILDEPTIGLDPNQIRQVRAIIRDLGRDHTVLISTHILPEVEMVCDRVVNINQGRVAAEDSLEGLRHGKASHWDYHLEVRGEKAGVQAALSEVPGVEGVGEEMQSGMPEGVEVFTFRAATNSDAAERAAAALVGKGYSIRELRRRRRTLEDVFIEVVGRDFGGEDASAEIAESV